MSQPTRQATPQSAKQAAAEPSAPPYYTVETFEPMRSLGFLIKRCGTLMSLIAESKFASQPITFTQWLVLMKLRFHQQMSASHLSAEIGHDMGALTRLVDSLEKEGFVRRERSLRDRRAVEITLTAAGKRQVEGTIGILVDMLNELIQPFSRNETDTLIILLQRMLGMLQDYVGATEGGHPAPQTGAAVTPSATPRSRATRQRKTAGGKK
jgi:DNA-binding MarR family transcriptional regulator